MTYEEIVKLASDEQVHVLVAAVRQLHHAGRLRAALTKEQWAGAQTLVEAVEQEAARRRAQRGESCVVCRSRVHTVCSGCERASEGRVRVAVCANERCVRAHEAVARCGTS